MINFTSHGMMDLSFLFKLMNKQVITESSKEEWREHVLQQIVQFLGANKDEIYDNYASESKARLTKQVIDEEGLMDFELAITFLVDKKGWFGLGSGFFKANLIR